MTYKDSRGYKREHSNLWHRKIAYYKIYLKNRKKYPLPFESYEVHHIDEDKDNNDPKNLALLTPEEHIDIHLEQDRIIQKKEYKKARFGDIRLGITMFFILLPFVILGSILAILFILTVSILIGRLIMVALIFGGLWASFVIASPSTKSISKKEVQKMRKKAFFIILISSFVIHILVYPLMVKLFLLLN